MFDCMLDNIIRTAQKSAEVDPDDYERDGLLYCHRCGTAKQHRIKTPSGKDRVVPCMCACQSARYDQDRQEERKRREMEEIERLRSRASERAGGMVGGITEDGVLSRQLGSLETLLSRVPSIFRDGRR